VYTFPLCKIHADIVQLLVGGAMVKSGFPQPSKAKLGWLSSYLDY